MECCGLYSTPCTKDAEKVVKELVTQLSLAQKEKEDLDKRVESEKAQLVAELRALRAEADPRVERETHRVGEYVVRLYQEGWGDTQFSD